ncbi:hypothetical protein [Pararhizobium sp. PWRC1-1]|uniref:hypothetical protein n=1 Tax=Pararhizobium sp. PWRC1-1 TaxID=2804566 RepID=UPI003CF73BF6
MTIVPAKLKVSHPDPKFRSQSAVGRAVYKVLADASAHGWSMEKTNSEMEMVLGNLRLSYIDGVSGNTKATQYSDLANDIVSRPAPSAAAAARRPIGPG